MATFHKGLVYPLNRSNVDTDQIIPKQFLKRIERQGFGQFLFYDWRFDSEGQPRQSFSLNDPKYQGASVLVAGDNFGCGSSREHAPWALEDYGFKVIISTSFADIFYNNCVKNGMVPVQVKEVELKHLIEAAEKENYEIEVDLANETLVGSDGFTVSFEVPDYQREMLLNGWDEISLTMQHEKEITAYEQKMAK